MSCGPSMTLTTPRLFAGSTTSVCFTREPTSLSSNLTGLFLSLPLESRWVVCIMTRSVGTAVENRLAVGRVSGLSVYFGMEIGKWQVHQKEMR